MVGSIGQGNYAEIPWICIFNTRITTTATKGIYIVILYTADGNGIYLELGQGITYFTSTYGNRLGREKANLVASNLRAHLHIPDKLDLIKRGGIDLKGVGSLSKGYEAGTVAGIYYELSSLPPEQVLVENLVDLLELYAEVDTLIGDKRSYEQFAEYLLALRPGVVFVDPDNNELLPEIPPLSYALPRTSLIETTVIIDIPEEKLPAVIQRDGKEVYPRDNRNIDQSILRANFQCEYDKSHESFKWSRFPAEMYVEGHHLIPISEHKEFDSSLDVLANIVCLCDTCHAAVHHGMEDDKRKIITRLYQDRVGRLRNAGIYISSTELLQIYGVDE